MQKFELTSEQELPKVVADVLELLGKMKREDGAAVLALHGDLGAGKTTFTQALARSLGVDEKVTSPTFVVMKGYETTDSDWLYLIHVDAYRIEDIDEMRVLHFADLLQQKDTIICIEWAEKIVDLLPPETIHLDFMIENETRSITLRYG